MAVSRFQEDLPFFTKNGVIMTSSAHCKPNHKSILRSLVISFVALTMVFRICHSSTFLAGSGPQLVGPVFVPVSFLYDAALNLVEILLLLAWVILVELPSLLGRMARERQHREKELARGTWIQLLRAERTKIAGFHGALSPGLESHFVGADVDATFLYLKQRAELIAQVNPWVLGRIRSHPVTGASSLWIPPNPDCASFFQEIWVEKDESLEAGLPQMRVGTGFECLDSDVPIVKLCAVRSKDRANREFILGLCICHLVGEPTFLYSTWDMLNESAPIQSLVVERNHLVRGSILKTYTAVRKFCYFAFVSDSSPFRLHFGHKSLSPKDPVVTVRYINETWVQEQKEAHDRDTPGAPFLSTLDILTSWFFSQFNPSCGNIVMDMRNRHPGLTDLHQGNYQEMVVLFPKEYREAAGVRRAINTLGQVEPRHNPSGEGTSCGLVTGWHSSYKELNLPFCQRLSHLPLRAALSLRIFPDTYPSCAFSEQVRIGTPF